MNRHEENFFVVLIGAVGLYGIGVAFGFLSEADSLVDYLLGFICLWLGACFMVPGYYTVKEAYKNAIRKKSL